MQKKEIGRKKTLIIGAGLCGLSAAYHLEKIADEDYLVLERCQEVGGLCRTETYDGFSFDRSIHILYTRDEYSTDLISDKLLDNNLLRQTRESYCYTANVYTEYPYQANNYGLPVEIITENILGLIEAYYDANFDNEPQNFQEWIYRTFGTGIAENFMIPYNRRVWAWDLKDMSYHWIADRVPMPKIEDVLSGALKPPDKKYGLNREFWYPAEGGIESLSNAFLSYVPSERIRCDSNVVAIDGVKQEIKLSDGNQINYERLISSLPMPSLIHMLGANVPIDVRQAAAKLKHNIVHTVNIGLEGPNLGVNRLMHWVYYPEDALIFHRISFPSNFSPWMVPIDCCSIQAEISESVYKPLDRSTLIAETLDDLVRVGLLNSEEARPVSQGGRVRVAKIVTLNPAYIIYDLEHQVNTRIIKNYLSRINIETRGRFGEWEYFNMDHSILSGKRAVDNLALRRFVG